MPWKSFHCPFGIHDIFELPFDRENIFTDPRVFRSPFWMADFYGSKQGLDIEEWDWSSGGGGTDCEMQRTRVANWEILRKGKEMMPQGTLGME